jgi:hypothetical protein
MTAFRLTATGGDDGEILCVRSTNVLGSVPERRRVEGEKTADCGSAKIRGRKKGSIVTPKKRTGKGGRGKSDMNSIMVTTGEVVKDGGRGKGGMAHIHEDMI